MAPLTDGQGLELKSYGITDILIFRNDVPGETATTSELELLQRVGFATSSIHKIPFPWKGMSTFEEPCRQTLKALQIMRDVLNSRTSKMYFHCTVGEDRTGYLAGLFRIIFEGASETAAFKDEMCGKGYAEGDPCKPPKVSIEVHKNITVVYLKLVEWIEAGLISKDNLDPEICKRESGSINQIRRDLAEFLRSHRCEKQPLANSRCQRSISRPGRK